MSAKTVGFIVTIRGRPAFASKQNGVLYIATRGNAVSVFTTKALAEAAIRRSLKYAAEHGIDWRRDEYHAKRANAVEAVRG
jgi:hypothetical protein